MSIPTQKPPRPTARIDQSGDLPLRRNTRVWGLESLPSHWREKPLKRVASINTDKLGETANPDLEIEYVDIGNVNLEHGITSTERMRFEVSPSRARRLVQEGDTIVSTVRTYLKAVAKITNCPQNLVVSTGFAVIRAGTEVDSGYLYRLAQSDVFVERVVAHSVGVSYPAINATDIGGFVIPLPPLDEQQSIAAYLDAKTADIDSLIRLNDRLIARLHDERNALISYAVTRGIDSDENLTDSRCPWLGAIPQNWEKGRLKHRLLGIEQGWSPQCENRQAEPGEWGVLKVGCMNSGFYDETENKALPSNLEPAREYEIHVGDLLMSRSNTSELVGSVGRVHSTQGRIMLCDKLYRLKINGKKLNPDYAVHLLRSHSSRTQLERDATGASASMKNISTDRVGNLIFPFPPLAEQSRILAYLTQRLSKLDALIARVRDGLIKLKNYRSALITTAVTGQIDLRNYQKEALCP